MLTGDELDRIRESHFARLEVVQKLLAHIDELQSLYETAYEQGSVDIRVKLLMDKKLSLKDSGLPPEFGGPYA